MEMEYVHYCIPGTRTREERIITKVEEIIDKKLEEKKMEHEKKQRFIEEILRLKAKYFPKDVKTTVSKIVIGNDFIITAEAVVIDGVPVETGNEEIDVERIFKKIEQLNEKDVVII